ncbi:alpha/beta fold hydrolase [Paractinoplanes toevensis]|uniref:alpha/beta fold hydrolase n=1 Tax=Paractinoplanes toevensis TaxID=571911 RepID=UPI001FEC1BA1|nr:alpha/beta hydrolase [Actinoplanes toevensis]
MNGIELCLETFGDPADPALLLIAGGASSMDWWEDEFCRRLAAAGRFVIRYDHRDTGRSTSFPPGEPPYSGVDLAHDALGVLDALGIHRAHVVGLSMGGALAQRIAAERPHRVLSLTLMSTTLGAAPESDDAPPEASVSGPGSPVATTDGDISEMPDWSDRKSSVERMITATKTLGGLFTAGDAHLRRLAERIFDRTNDMAATQLNHWCCQTGPPLRRPLCGITAPTLILHGTLDPMFPAEHAHALAAEIPGSRLVWLEGVGHEFPPAAVWQQVIDEIVGHAARGRQPA